MSDRPGDPVENPADGGTFRAEYERELGTWLRRRLGWLCIAFALFKTFSTVLLVVSATPMASTDAPQTIAALEEAVATELTEPAELAELAGADDDAPGTLTPTDASAPAGAGGDELDAVERDRARGREAVVSSIDAFGDLLRNVADRLDDSTGRAAPRAKGDAWWLESGTTAPDGSAATEAGAAIPQAIPAAGEEAVADGGPDQTPDAPPAPGPTVAADESALIPWWVWVLVSLPSYAVVGWFGIAVRPRLFTRTELVAAATRMILVLGLLNFAVETALLLTLVDPPVTPLLSILYWHFTASLFLPWSWRESLRPIVPLLVCWFMLRLGLVAENGEWLAFVVTIVSLPLVLAPALLLCYVRLRWHRNRFKSVFVGRRFLAMRREFMQARAVHESVFPKPIDAGWMRFDFSYRPAADIGGDFIHAWVDADDRFHLAILDVTGHGLASAMSVARIHGEIERLRDEYPDEGPAKLLARLNRYFRRLLARHRLYATGVLMTLDPRTGELRYASAGHPPVFLRSRGDLTELGSTTFLLGAVDNDEFGEDEMTVQLEEGDTLLGFTDGAYDARSPRGDRFGLDRLREIMRRRSAPPKWSAFILRLVETFEGGLPEDDLLIAEVHFLRRTSISSITGDEPPVPARSYSEATR